MIHIKIIEMTGLPGSGKSYLLNNLSPNNMQIINEETFYSQCATIKTKKKIKELIKFIIMHIDIVICLYLYAFINCKVEKEKLSKVFEILKYISLYNCIIEINKEHNIIIFDQGILQYIWSLTFFEKKSMSKSVLLKYIFQRLEKIYSFYCFYYLVDYKTAAKRASTREKKCKIDYLEYNEIYKLYNEHYNDHQVFLNYLDKEHYFIVTQEENISTILKKLKEKIKK